MRIFGVTYVNRRSNKLRNFVIGLVTTVVVLTAAYYIINYFGWKLPAQLSLPFFK